MGLLIRLLLCLLLAASACADHPTKGAPPIAPKPKQQEQAPRPPHKKPPAPAPAKSAVLLSGVNLDFCAQTEWTGGAENYRREVNELTQLLLKNRVAADIVTDEQIKSGKLWNYRALYIIDTFAIDAATVESIKNFVRGGGVLVGIGEVGRYQSGWTQVWPFADIFGLKPIPVDEYGTSVSRDGYLYRQAPVTEEGKSSALLSGLPAQISFGPLAQSIWATEADGAKILAAYPKHARTVVQAAGNKKYETVEQPVSAVSLRRLERGTAVYVSVLPGDRKPGKLLESGDTGVILRNAPAYGADKIVRVSTPPPAPVLAFSQAGYLPHQQKSAVLSVDASVLVSDPEFSVYSHPGGDRLLEGKMQEFPGRFWNAREWIADFTELSRPGAYWIEVSWKEGGEEKSLRGSVFEIDPDLYRLKLIPSQLSFFQEYRCGERCHKDSPIPGGYHDATGDWSVRMWSMPSVVYGLARYLEADSSAAGGPAQAELARAIDWCLKMQGENGEVYEGVVPPEERSDIKVRPWEEKAPRKVQIKDNAGYRLWFVAGMARAAAALKQKDPELSRKVASAAAKSREFSLKDASGLRDTGDIGNWIFGNMELYRATGEAKYLEEAKKFAQIQLSRQHRCGGEVEGAPVCGDFFDGEDMTKFGRHQYKTFHQLGIYAGLVELHAALTPGDPLWWPLHAALERLVHGYFRPMASVTPYGLVGKALERGSPDKKWRIYFFDNPKAWEGAHFGYNSDYLAEGLIALDYARQTGQPEFVDFAEDQVEWMLGFNPLGYSMVDGVGTRIAPMIDDKLGTGRVFGGIANGFEGEGAKNLPVWGASWNSREYWLPHNAFFLPLIAELQYRRAIPAQAVPFEWNVEKKDEFYIVSVPEPDKFSGKFELLVDGGKIQSTDEEQRIWAVAPNGNEPLVLLLRYADKPGVYRQRVFLNP